MYWANRCSRRKTLSRPCHTICLETTVAERGGLAQFSLHHPVRTIIFVQSLLRNRLGANIFIQQVMLLVHLSPIILVLIVIALGRRPPVQAAMAGALLALALWLQGLAVPYSHVVAGHVLQDAGVLFAGVASVMAPGLLLVVLMAQTDANRALCDWVQGLGLHAQGQLVFILLGLGPMLESLTGFGVSWIAVVPLLLALFPRKQAVRMALASMLIMPWGTLGLATVTGAALLNTPADVLARYTALTSAPVFVGLMGVAVWLAGYRHWQALLAVAASSVLFAALLYAAAYWMGAELAGVGAGAAMVALGLVRSDRLTWPQAAWPYAVLLACVLGIKLLLWAIGGSGQWALHGAQTAWRPLASPGIPLLLVCAAVLWKRGLPAGGASVLWRAWWQRAWKPLATIFCFLLMSQLMAKAGLLDGLRALLAQANGWALPPLVALLGGVGGYVTGSNVGGNVLMVPALLGWEPPVLAAMLNSAVGHAALGSLPMLALLAGLSQLDKAEEQSLNRFALGVVALNMLLVAAGGMVWQAFL